MKGSHAFIFDAPDLTGIDYPADAEAPADVPDQLERPRSRIQVAKTGKYRHPAYGRFTVTRDTFDKFIANLPRVLAGAEAPIDFDHEPQTTGNTRACGWIKELEIDGDQLMATVEWTWEGFWAIKDRAYRYFSPTWHPNFRLDDGTEIGPTLLGGGLTNYPFFNRMAVVNLSRSFSRDDFALAEEDEQPMPRRDHVFAAALLQLNAADQETVRTVYGRDPEAGMHVLNLLLSRDG